MGMNIGAPPPMHCCPAPWLRCVHPSNSASSDHPSLKLFFCCVSTHRGSLQLSAIRSELCLCSEPFIIWPIDLFSQLLLTNRRNEPFVPVRLISHTHDDAIPAFCLYVCSCPHLECPFPPFPSVQILPIFAVPLLTRLLELESISSSSKMFIASLFFFLHVMSLFLSWN